MPVSWLVLSTLLDSKLKQLKAREEMLEYRYFKSAQRWFLRGLETDDASSQLVNRDLARRREAAQQLSQRAERYRGAVAVPPLWGFGRTGLVEFTQFVG